MPTVDLLLEYDTFDEEWALWNPEGLHSVPDVSNDSHAGILLRILTKMFGPGWSIYNHVEGHWVVNTLRQDGPSRQGLTLGEAVAKMLLVMLQQQEEKS